VSALDLLHWAKTAALQAGDYLRRVQRPAGPTDWSRKGNHDYVTEVDRTAEHMISDVLTKGVPGGRIVGEELSPTVQTRGLVWVVDPLDGTTNFLHDYPSFAVSIAAAVDGVLEAAVVHHVPMRRTYYGWRGGGAWLDGQRLHVSTIAEPEFALIGTGFPFRDLSGLVDYQRQFAAVAAATSGIRRPGAASIDLADVAAGRFDGFWEQRLSAWDIAAGILLIREAGGRITNREGRDIGIEHTEVVAGNPVIHTWLLEVLQPENSHP
jgi:myo-inositol-1(or 4)-monophosphatase